MSEANDTDPDELIAQLNESTEEIEDALADDLDASIGQLASRADMSGPGANPMPISPEQGIEILRPMIRQKAARDPESVLRFLALMHLESGALLQKHSDTDPTALL